MMFQAVGHRPRIEQRVRLGATRDGKLTSLQHDYVNHTSMLDDYKENCGEATPHMYSVPEPARHVGARAPQRRHADVDARARARCPGSTRPSRRWTSSRSSSAMDPVALRLTNEPAIDEGTEAAVLVAAPRECFATGAERFGWAKRDPEVGSMKRDGLDARLGHGGAAPGSPSASPAARASSCATTAPRASPARTQDIGTGTYTILAQLASEKLGLPLEKVEVVLGDTRCRRGRSRAARWRPARRAGRVRGGREGDRRRCSRRRRRARLAVRRTKAEELRFAGGRVHAEGGRRRAACRSPSCCAGQRADASPGRAAPRARSATDEAEVLEALVRRAFRRGDLAAGDRAAPREPRRLGDRRRPHPQPARRPQSDRGRRRHGHRHGAASRRPPTTRATARPINASLADYVVASNADVPTLEVHFLEYPDMNLNALGARGIGEIGLAGIAAAIDERGAPRDRRARARAADQDRAPARLTSIAAVGDTGILRVRVVG